MIDRRYNLKKLIRYTATVVCLITPFCSSQVIAEKYFTWVDEMGRVNHTVIPEEENPLIKKERSEPEVTVTPIKESPNQPISSPTQTNSISSDVAAEKVTPEDVTSEKITPTTSSPENSNELQEVGDSPSLELKAAPITGNKQPPVNTSVGRQVEINEDDYIDGDVLLEQGGIRDEDDLPYYTWTDERGIIRNTPYRPANEPSAKEGVKAIKKKEALVYTVHEEYRRGEPKGVETNTAEQKNIDSFAQKLFFDGQKDNFVDSFSNKCCGDLPKESPSLLAFEDSVYVEFEVDADSYIFSEGKSPFKLVELPRTKEVYSLRLKSFVKTSGKRGIKNGVFFPQLVFLDEQFQVLRIIRNPALEFTPENWHRHGYLKGLFKIDGRDKERYMLINTTKDSLRARNLIENKTVVVLSNQLTGSVELEALIK